MKILQVNSSKFEKDCEELSKKIKLSKISFSNVVGIPRGGVPVAVRLSSLLDLPLSSKIDGKSLIVDDLIDSGSTMKKWLPRKWISKEGVWDCAVLYTKPHSPKVSFFSEALKENDWIEFFYEEKTNDMEGHVLRILESIGENPLREGLKDTPKRVVRMWEEIYGGYGQDEKELFRAVFKSNLDEMVIVKDIPFYSTCEHHMVPFIGKAHVGYLPNGKVLGLSKIARLVDLYSRRLQIQEELTKQIAESLDKNLNPFGVMVVMEAEHLCMSMRGIRKPGTKTITSVTLGSFRDQDKTRNEFLRMIKND